MMRSAKWLQPFYSFSQLPDSNVEGHVVQLSSARVEELLRRGNVTSLLHQCPMTGIVSHLPWSTLLYIRNLQVPKKNQLNPASTFVTWSHFAPSTRVAAWTLDSIYVPTTSLKCSSVIQQNVATRIIFSMGGVSLTFLAMMWRQRLENCVP